MKSKDRRENSVEERRNVENRRRGTRRENNRGVVDRRGSMERRNKSRRMDDREKKILDDLEKIFEDQVEGRNAVLEILENGGDINKLYITKGERKGSISKIIALANERKIVIVEKEKSQMDIMAQTENYQGVIAIVPPYKYAEIEDVLEVAKERNEDPFILILDGIEDSRNLGAIIRTAETAGVHGVVIPKRRAALVNSTVSKVACGALEHIKVVRVTNISETMKKLKEKGIWICGTSLDAKKSYLEQDFTGPLAIVIGNEGKGIGDLVKKNCDFLVKIPMKGKVQSLNASVSTGIVLYEALKQRG